MITIYEKLNLSRYLIELTLGRACYFSQKTLLATMADRLLLRIPMLGDRLANIKAFGWGDTRSVGHAISNASRNANQHLTQLSDIWSPFSNIDDCHPSINVALLLKKYLLVKVLYQKYFFYELFIQFVAENVGTKIALVAERSFIGDYEGVLKSQPSQTFIEQGTHFLEALVSLICLPVLLPLLWKTKLSGEIEPFEDRIICSVESPQMVQGYKELFSSESDIVFVVAPAYAANFAEQSRSVNDLFALSLTLVAFNELTSVRKYYYWKILKNYSQVSCLGLHLIRFFNVIIHGRILTPPGPGNYVFASEHHDLTKTVRNEFIRCQGSTSILFPYSSLYVLQYYPDEYYENYDCICSPGKHYEDALKQNQAKNSVCLQTGSYTIHKDGLSRGTPPEKIAALKSFLGGNYTITVLCPGVCKPTFHSEVKLMELAQRLSKIDGVRVVIRQKPFMPKEQYSGFYERYSGNNSSMLLTGREYELFDFLPVTDLFITSYSTSACELAACGANIYFVDFLEQDDRFIFWKDEIAGGLVLKECEAYERISLEINDAPDGPLRTGHREQMKKFANYIGYIFEDYKTYKDNLFAQLNCHVFSDIGNESANEKNLVMATK